MNDSNGYAVFIYPEALTALGDPIKPYVHDGDLGGPHVLCREIDTGGAFIEMTLDGRDANGNVVTMELMLPGSMVRMVVSTRSDGEFGFIRRPVPTTATSEPPTAMTDRSELPTP